jgi:hypothetical protein
LAKAGSSAKLGEWAHLYHSDNLAGHRSFLLSAQI